MKCIGFISDSLDADYQRSLWDSLASVCRTERVNLIAFHAGGINNPEEMARFNKILPGVVKRTPVSALLVTSAVLSNHQTPGEYSRFLESLKPLPVISIGLRMEGYPSRVCDDADGLADLIVHLMQVHKRKGFVFIRGLPHNADSQKREQVFLQTLETAGLKPLDGGILTGDFRQDIAAAVLGEWLVSNPDGDKLDAVVAANDQMAMGAMELLKSRGMAVPQAISVTGFDDVAMARFLDPPLTTVQQPLDDLMRTAVLNLGDMSRGVAVKTRAVIRRSCGCFGNPDSRGDGEDPVAALWFNALKKDLSENQEGIHFVNNLEVTLTTHAEEEILFSCWQRKLSEVRQLCLDNFPPDRMPAAENVLHLGRVFLQEKGELHHSHETVKQKMRDFLVHIYSSNLGNGYTLDYMISQLGSYLTVHEINNCQLSLFEPDKGPGEIDLILSLDKGQSIPPPPDSARMKIDELFARYYSGEKEPYVCIVQPLFHEETPLALFMVDATQGMNRLNDGVGAQIRSTIKGAQLMEELNRRALDLEKANARIKNNQQQLLVSEKMASLGRLTAGIAHEMNTPLATVRAAIDELKRLVSEYAESVDDPAVLPDDHKAIAGDMSRSLVLADKASEKAASFIRSIKTQTREIQNAQTTVFDTAVVAREALSLLEYTSRHKNVAVVFESPDKPLPVQGSPGRFSQVVTNLVNNALDAVARDSGRIVVSVSAEAGALALRVSDNGTGIPDSIRARIFDPLFTTKPFGEGTGLGLTLVNEIVTGDFGGTIEFESTEGAGTRFLVLLKMAEGVFDGTQKFWN
jgi:signal transduction histidine kinase/DNA-binding LacI/PurR family transcriptional regulator